MEIKFGSRESDKVTRYRLAMVDIPYARSHLTRRKPFYTRSLTTKKKCEGPRILFLDLEQKHDSNAKKCLKEYVNKKQKYPTEILLHWISRNGRGGNGMPNRPRIACHSCAVAVQKATFTIPKRGQPVIMPYFEERKRMKRFRSM